MAKTSVARDKQDAEVRRLAETGLSQRQIASRLGVTRSMVQRILDSSDPVVYVDSEIAGFRREVIQELDALYASNSNSFVRSGEVHPYLLRIEKAEDRFNREMCLTGMDAVQAAKLRRMMTEGAING